MGQREPGRVAEHPATTRCQRHRSGRPHQGVAAEHHRQPAGRPRRHRADRPYPDHPRLGQGRATRTADRHRVGGHGHFPVPATGQRHHHPIGGRAAIVDRHLRRDVPRRVLGQQPDPDGPDHRHRFRGGRCDRDAGEHFPLYRRRRKPAERGVEGCEADRLHPDFPDLVADRRVDPVAVHG
ncbi:hypothetical protein D3C71_1044300 [compost metagenome]